jgi:hypothetical protein
VLRRQYTSLDNDEKEWVEFGFARFPDPQKSDQALVDEPLIILAATYHLNTCSSMGLSDRVLNGLGQAKGRGTTFEEFVAVYLARAFGPDVSLSHVFDFGEDAPSWASLKGVKFVAFSSNGDHHIVDHALGPSSALSCDLANAEETVKWFRKPYTMMCFPDKFLGPDLVFFIRLSNGMVLCVLVQAKFRSVSHLTQGDQVKATSALKSSNFYKNDVSSLQGVESSLSRLSSFLTGSHRQEVGSPSPRYYRNCP